MYRAFPVLLFIFLCALHDVYSKPSYCQKCPTLQKITSMYKHTEGPHWHSGQQALYFVDIAGHSVLRYCDIDGSIHKLQLNDTVSFAVPIMGRPNSLVIGLGRSLVVLNWDGKSTNYNLQTIASVDNDHPGNRFNDAKADAIGRLWSGTMGREDPVGTVVPNEGKLYIWDSDKCEVQQKYSPVSISNGIAWNKDNSIMYYIDTQTRKISAFDYNLKKGKISNKRTVFSLNDIPGNPDGMTIDDNGNLWVACWGGSRVINVDPKKGLLLRTILLPVERVTSVTFGGVQMKTLYITTMRAGLNSTQLEAQPDAGSVFKVTNLGVRGTDNKQAKIFC